MKSAGRSIRFLLGACFAITLAAAPARALIVPSPIATDARIKTIMYSPNEVFKYTGYYRYASSIEFAPDEEIGTILMGDSLPWQFSNVGNRLFLKPIEQDATTNMTVITNKRTYFFELHAEEAKNINDKNLIFALRFIYPDDNGPGGVMTTGADHVPDLEEEDLGKYNFKYTISGSEDIAPIRIFDDGEFTYFEFRDKNGEIPAFFMVDREGNEAIINYRTRGNYIVVERVAPRFTLRHGTSVACVFNETIPFRKVEKHWYDFGSSASAAPQPATTQK